MPSPETATPEPERDCPLCPRLVAYRHANQAAHPDWFNGPVPSFGTEGARLLIVGLAPGVQGANRTGRPFTGDFAGDLLYSTLHRIRLLERPVRRPARRRAATRRRDDNERCALRAAAEQTDAA